MSNTVYENSFYPGMALNQSNTAAVFSHWFSTVLRLMLVLMLSCIFFWDAQFAFRRVDQTA